MVPDLRRVIVNTLVLLSSKYPSVVHESDAARVADAKNLTLVSTRVFTNILVRAQILSQDEIRDITRRSMPDSLTSDGMIAKRSDNEDQVVGMTVWEAIAIIDGNAERCPDWFKELYAAMIRRMAQGKPMTARESEIVTYVASRIVE